MPDALLETFTAECDEILAELERAVLALAESGDEARSLEAMFRATHTLKGNATCLGFDGFTRVAHHLEAALQAALQRGSNPELVSLTLAAIDAMTRHARACAGGEDVVVDASESALCGRLDAWAEAAPSEPTAPAQTAEAPTLRARHIRVTVDRLDRAMDLVGELAVARGRVAGALARGDFLTARQGREAEDQRFAELHQLVLELRLVPLRTVFERLHRAVRDLAAVVGKAARLEVVCDDVEVDMAVAEALRAPLTHLLRNSIDHGIELPATRTAAGKPPAGTIRVLARREGGTLLVELSDDGGGIDRARLREKARELGLAADELDDEALCELVFTPGLSTAREVTDLSGRGIGMDVVRRGLESMRGSVTLSSQPGRGTTVRLRLPLTLSIISGLAVGVGGETCVLPLDHVVECVDLARDRVIAAPDGGVLELRGDALPFLELGRRLGLGRQTTTRPSIVVIEHEGKRAGLAVDALIGEVETVIKPLPRLCEGVRGLAGSAVLADGRVALVVDVPGLMRGGKDVGVDVTG